MHLEALIFIKTVCLSTLQTWNKPAARLIQYLCNIRAIKVISIILKFALKKIFPYITSFQPSSTLADNSHFFFFFPPLGNSHVLLFNALNHHCNETVKWLAQCNKNMVVESDCKVVNSSFLILPSFILYYICECMSILI